MNHAPRPHRSHEAVLLDLDGTLVASRDGIVGSLRRMLVDLGHAPDPAQDLTWVVGPPLRDIMERLLSGYGDDRYEHAILRYRHHYEAGGLFESPLFPGIHEAVAQLAASGRRLFLATSKPLHIARRILDARELTPLFAGLHGARPDESGAEKPELIASLLEHEGVDRRHAVMVGDRRFDISGAHANGVRAIGALWGYGGREELELAGADALVESPDELVRAIEAQLDAAAAHD